MLISTPPPKALFIKLNVLIDEDGNARLADFGLLTIVLESTHHTNSSTSTSAGTKRWMSPELLDPDHFGCKSSRPTKDSDCYALGMVILEVLSGKPPFTNCNDVGVVRKVIEGEHPGRPQGREEVWFTDDLWEMLERCWSSQPERRPAVDAVLQCLEQGSAAWQPLPQADSDDYASSQSDSDDGSDFTWSHEPGIDQSMFLHLFLNFAHPQMAPFVAARIDPHDDDRTLVPSKNEPRSVYAGQDSHQPSLGSQQGLGGLPVSVVPDMADTFVLYDNL